MTKDFCCGRESRRYALGFCRFLFAKAGLDVCSLSCSFGDATAGLPCKIEQKTELFFTRNCFVVKPTSVQQI